jgi:hypothetical protein
LFYLVLSFFRAHLLIQELYVDHSALSSSANYSAFHGNVALDPMTGAPIASHGGGRGGYGGSSGYADGAETSSSSMSAVPFPNLVNYGVQPETVRQLSEMKAYLWRHVIFCTFSVFCCFL